MRSRRRLTSSSALSDLDVAGGLVARGLALGPVVLDGRLDRILSKHRAVELDGRQAELLSDLSVLDLARLLERHTLDTLSHVGRASNGRAASKSLESNILDDALLVDLDRKLHHIAAGRGTDEADTDILISLEE